MEHENLLEAAAFWDDIQQAVAKLAGFSYTPVEAPRTYSDTTYPNYGDDAGQSQNWDENPSPHLEVPLDGDDRREGEVREGEAPAEPEPATSADNSPTPVEPEAAPPPEPSPQPGPDEWRTHLRNAAQKLVSAREVLYPVTIHLLDICLLDDKNLDQPWPVRLTLGTPLNVVASGQLLEKLAAEQPAKLDLLKAKIAAEEAEVCGGCYLEREDPLLPLDSQLWNLQQGPVGVAVAARAPTCASSPASASASIRNCRCCSAPTA